jgi:cyclophilin family peptidyl-prolyl cis-trans isomerase
MRRRALITPLAAAALVLAACGDEEGDSTTTPTAKCADVEAPEPKDVKLKRPDLDEPPPPGSRAQFATNCGSFTIELDPEKSPRTTASFAYLVQEGLYDGTSIHRVAPDYVVQGGDPLGDGTGGPGYSVDEPPPPNTSYTEDVVAMAKTEAEPPGRSGSQFYVVTGTDLGLPPDYAVLGKLVEGDATMRAIENLGDPTTETPSQPVVIESAELITEG